MRHGNMCADASSRAAVAASAAAAAVAVTKAAAARAAAKVRKRAGKEHAGQGGNGVGPEWSKDNGARPRKRSGPGLTFHLAEVCANACRDCPVHVEELAMNMHMHEGCTDASKSELVAGGSLAMEPRRGGCGR